MKKLLITTALLFTALPFTFDGVTPAISKAHARIGRPFTPVSFAGVHRRAVRRTFGVGANLGGYYGAGYGGGYGTPLYDYAGAAPDEYAGAAPVGFAVAAPGWGGGWGGWGWNRPFFGAGLGWGGGWGVGDGVSGGGESRTRT
jgi:hypothetical protein